MNILRWVHNRIKDNDLYAKSVTLTFKGKTTFSTSYGGVISCLIKLTIIIIAIIRVSIIFNRSDTSKSINKVVKDIVHDDTKHYIGKGTFAIAFGLVDQLVFTSLLTDSTYFSFQIFQQINNRTDPQFFNHSLIALEYEL